MFSFYSHWNVFDFMQITYGHTSPKSEIYSLFRTRKVKSPVVNEVKA